MKRIVAVLASIRLVACRVPVGVSIPSEKSLLDISGGFYEELREAESKYLGETWFANIPEKHLPDIPHTLEGKATVDSCFCDYTHVSFEPCTVQQINEGCENRTSESYAWGMTRTADYVFWGTVANEQCIETPGNYQTYSGMACTNNFDQNWKIPSVYMLDVKDNSYRSIAPADMTEINFDRLNNTVGLRSAGQKAGVVILGGFGKTLESVYTFSFNSATGDFLCSREFENSNDVRKFTQNDSHELYVGVSRTDGTGDIFRFTGSLQDPCAFGLVANVPGNPAEVTFYHEKLLVSTWVTSSTLRDFSEAVPPFMMLSPAPVDHMPVYASREELATASSGQEGKWTKLWGVESYEPDPVVAYSFGLSLCVVVDDWVYWGTLQYPLITVELYVQLYPENFIDRREAMLKSHRGMSLFRGRYLDSDHPEVELLYGEVVYPVYHPDDNSWRVEPNKLTGNKKPVFGRAGFGNTYNMYLWSMNMIDDKLVIGTFDDFGITPLSYRVPLPPTELGYRHPLMGADLYVMELGEGGSIGPAQWLTLDGYSTPTNFGMRNLLVNQFDDDDKTVYLGTTNPYNVAPKGGWEVIKIDF